MRTQQSTNSTPDSPSTLHVRFLSFIPFVRRFSALRDEIWERTNGITECALQSRQGEVNGDGTGLTMPFFFYFHLQWLRCRRWKWLTSDWLRWRDWITSAARRSTGLSYTSRRIRYRRQSFVKHLFADPHRRHRFSFTRNRNVHNRKMTRLSNLGRFRRGNDPSRH